MADTVMQRTSYHKNILTSYDESDSHVYGCGRYDQSIDFESFYGVKLYTGEDAVTYELYANIDHVKVEKVTLESISGRWQYTVIDTLPANRLNTKYSLSVKGLKDGVYAIVGDFDDNISDFYQDRVAGFITVKNGNAKTCRITDATNKELQNTRNTWNQLTLDMDPQKYLDETQLSYPSTDRAAYSSVREYQILSDQILKDHDDWNDSVKAYAFVRYITDNYAYDNYREEKLHHGTRAGRATAKCGYLQYDNPEYYMYSNHVGICWDFVNAFTIMCRHHGIPCTSLADKDNSHTVNAVYLDGKWTAIDITVLVERYCRTEDTDPKLWKTYTDIEWDHHYGYQEDEMPDIDTQIWVFGIYEPWGRG